MCIILCIEKYRGQINFLPFSLPHLLWKTNILKKSKDSFSTYQNWQTTKPYYFKHNWVRLVDQVMPKFCWHFGFNFRMYLDDFWNYHRPVNTCRRTSSNLSKSWRNYCVWCDGGKYKKKKKSSKSVQHQKHMFFEIYKDTCSKFNLTLLPPWFASLLILMSSKLHIQF